MTRPLEAGIRFEAARARTPPLCRPGAPNETEREGERKLEDENAPQGVASFG